MNNNTSVLEYNMSKKHEVLVFDPAHSVKNLDGKTKIASISDLHIGVEHRGKLGGAHFITDEEIVNGVESIIESLKPEDGEPKSHLVLNGDIFEMVYCAEPSDETIKKLGKGAHDKLRDERREDNIKILKEWVKVAKENNCVIHYVCGNHDDDEKFVKKVQEFAAQDDYKENFDFHPVALRLGEIFFTHGDLPLRAGDDGIVPNKRELNRERHYVVETNDDDNVVKNPFSTGSCIARFCRKVENFANGEIHEFGNKIMYALNPNQKRAAKILTSLATYAKNITIYTQTDEPRMLEAFPENGVPTAATRICTGHTHDGCIGVKIPEDSAIYAMYIGVDTEDNKKILFDNTGAGVHMERLHALEYEMDGNEVQGEPRIIDKNLYITTEPSKTWVKLTKKWGNEPFASGQSRFG